MKLNANTKRKTRSQKRFERGNVLFLILIAVILFAALSYAVTSSSRSGGGGDAANETNLVNSAQITQYPASVRTAIVRMIVGGRLVEDLLFDRPTNFAAVETAVREADAVFHPQGGGATAVNAPSAVMQSGASGDWFFTSEVQINSIGITNNADNDANDMIAFLPGITKAVCRSLNRELGIPLTVDADGDDIPDGPAYIPTTTEEQALATPGIGGYSATLDDDFIAQPFGCYDAVPGTANDPTQNVYYHVLIER